MQMRIAGAQLHNAVGDLAGNARRIARAMQWAQQQEADVLVVPELALTGYPLADLVLHESFLDEAEAAMAELARQSGTVTSVISTVQRVPPQRAWDTRDRHVSIAAKLLWGGEVRGTYHKYLLPTYGIYDEGKNIAPGSQPDLLWRIGQVIAGVVICEDMWSPDGPPEAQSAAGAQVLLVPNASPYHRGRAAGRLRLARQVARRNGVPLVYINFFGGQDDLVFDGGSLIVDGDGHLLHRSIEFDEDRFCVDVPVAEPRRISGPVKTVHTRPLPERPTLGRRSAVSELPDDLSGVWQALVVATRDLTLKNDFPGVVLGLSGGIDSALTAVIACQALGPERVLALSMPSSHEPADEVDDARVLAENLGVSLQSVPITDVEQGLAQSLGARLGGQTSRETRRDLEAWSRAAVLSAYADERGMLILSTTNKSELSIGATRAGDLIGGYAPLRDCPKTLLFELARRCPPARQAIPPRVLDRQTTAQAEQPAAMPSYAVLDPIVERYLEQQAGLEELIDEGFDAREVMWVLKRVDEAEFLRQQCPMGVRITAVAFDQDRRMPISNAWRAHE